MAADPEILEPDVETDEERSTALRLRDPRQPLSIDELSRRARWQEILDARIQILETARLRAIRMTHPEDWVLFKSKDDRVTAYLQDSGCERVRPILSISIFAISEPEKIVSDDGQSFAVVIRGRGRSGLTHEEIEEVEGVRESTEDFCKDLKGVKQELRVRQAARANLDGRIVRELAGLGNVPIEELNRGWEGTTKKSEHCRKGRGFGTTQERSGGENPALATDLVPPHCPHCNAVAVLRTSARGPFYSCPKWKQHEEKKWTLDLEKWKADPRSKAAPAPISTSPSAAPSSSSPSEASPSQAPASSSSPAVEEPPPLTDEDIFGPKNGGKGRR